jgi:hypothetical protein
VSPPVPIGRGDPSSKVLQGDSLTFSSGGDPGPFARLRPVRPIYAPGMENARRYVEQQKHGVRVTDTELLLHLRRSHDVRVTVGGTAWECPTCGIYGSIDGGMDRRHAGLGIACEVCAGPCVIDEP